jgi:hypothetical protein
VVVLTKADDPDNWLAACGVGCSRDQSRSLLWFDPDPLALDVIVFDLAACEHNAHCFKNARFQNLSRHHGRQWISLECAVAEVTL